MPIPPWPKTPSTPRPRPLAPLDPTQRRRGRRLAFLSHPAGMTHGTSTPTSCRRWRWSGSARAELWIGLQRAFEPLSQLLQLPTLRAVGRLRKRTILVGGQAIAVVGGAPLVAYALAEGLGRRRALALALASLWLCAVGIVISQTVWFPLLRGYVEPGRIGEFFGVLRTGWHLILIALLPRRAALARPRIPAPSVRSSRWRRSRVCCASR